MDKRCKNYGSSWCADFIICNNCPARTFEFDKDINDPYYLDDPHYIATHKDTNMKVQEKRLY